LFFGDVLVYQTVRPRASVKPVDVYDALITGERWLIPPVEMVLDRVIQAEMVHRAAYRTRNRIAATKRAPTAFERFQSFQDAIEALGPECSTASDRKFVRRMLEWFEAKEAKFPIA
jgi:hypothetical protein